MRILDRASLLQNWTHHIVESCFFYVSGGGGGGGGARKQSSPQEPKGSVDLNADIADMRIPFQINCDCYT